jgi:hypothetical protein
MFKTTPRPATARYTLKAYIHNQSSNRVISCEECPPLYGVQRCRILATEEPPRRDKWPSERRYPLEALTEIQPRRRIFGRAKDGYVRVGCHFQSREPASCRLLQSKTQINWDAVEFKAYRLQKCTQRIRRIFQTSPKARRRLHLFKWSDYMSPCNKAMWSHLPKLYRVNPRWIPVFYNTIQCVFNQCDKLWPLPYFISIFPHLCNISFLL